MNQKELHIEYKEQYFQALNEFWNLQQISKTPPEEEYERLILDLENKLQQFKEEIEMLEGENDKLLQETADSEQIQNKYFLLKDEEKFLEKLNSDLNNL